MRVRYLDLTKGFAIILMIYAHTMSTVNCVHIWIYSFHMPIFFMVCGILLYKKRHKLRTAEEIKSTIIRRLYTAGIPYFVFGICLGCFYSFLNIIAHESVLFGSKMFDLFTLQGIDSLWFLLIGVLCFVFVIAFSHNEMNWYGNLFFKVLLGICFIEIGMLIEKSLVIERMSYIWIPILVFLGEILAQKNGSVEMSAGNIGNPIIYFAGAMATSIAIMGIWKKFEKYRIRILDIIEEYGKNSIVLLCTNNILIESIRLFDYKITGNILLHLGMLGSVLFTIILLAIEWLIIKLAKGALAPLFGNITYK